MESLIYRDPFLLILIIIEFNLPTLHQLHIDKYSFRKFFFVKNMKSWLLIWSSYMSTSCNLFSKLSFVIFVVLCRNRVSTLKRGRTTKKFPYNFCWQNFLLKEELLNISDIPFLRKKFQLVQNQWLWQLALLCDTQTIIHQNEGHCEF